MPSCQQLVIVHSWDTTALSENMKRASLSAYIKTQLQIAGKIAFSFNHKKNGFINPLIHTKVA